MKLHPEQQQLNKLNTYKEDEMLDEFDILHLYPVKPAFPSGFVDTMFFQLVMYNSITLTKKHGEILRDGLNLSECNISTVSVFLDGSYVINFNGIHNLVGITQYQFIQKK